MGSEEVEVARTGSASKDLDCRRKQQYRREHEEDKSEHEKDVRSKECLKAELSQCVCR